MIAHVAMLTPEDTHPHHGYRLPGGRIVLEHEYRAWVRTHDGSAVPVAVAVDPGCSLCRRTNPE